MALGSYSFVTVQTNLSGDSNPTLSGDLDVGTSDIVSSSNNDISLLPNGARQGGRMDGQLASSAAPAITDGTMEMRSGTSRPAQIDLYCERQQRPQGVDRATPLAHANHGGNVRLHAPGGTRRKRPVPPGRWRWELDMRHGRAARQRHHKHSRTDVRCRQDQDGRHQETGATADQTATPKSSTAWSREPQ